MEGETLIEKLHGGKDNRREITWRERHPQRNYMEGETSIEKLQEGETFIVNLHLGRAIHR